MNKNLHVTDENFQNGDIMFVAECEGAKRNSRKGQKEEEIVEDIGHASYSRDEKTILGLQLVSGNVGDNCHTDLGVVVIGNSELQSNSLVHLRRTLYEQVKCLPTAFNFCTTRGWTISRELEDSVQTKQVISENGVIKIQTTYKKPKIGLKTKNGAAVGFVFVNYDESLLQVRLAIQEQILSDKTISMDYTFLDSNDWPISKQQEQMLTVMDVLNGSCLTVGVGFLGNSMFPALQGVEDSPIEQPAKKQRISGDPELCTMLADQGQQMIEDRTSQHLTKKQILISYVRAEAAQHALNLKQELSSLGFSVYLDVHEIQSGSDWQDSLNNAINNCEVFVPLVTPTYGQTQWTNREVKLADVLGKFILPVNFLEQWPPRCLAIQFATTQYIHWKTPAQIQTEWAEGHHESVLDFRIWDVKFIVSVAEKIKDSLFNGGNAKKLLGLTKRKTVVKSCDIVKQSNEQAMTSNREGCPLVVVCLHPAQTSLGVELKAWLEGEDYEVWLTTELTISYPDSLPNSPQLSNSSQQSQDTALNLLERQNIETFQEKADDACVVLAILSKQFGNSRTCQQQVYYCEQRKRLLAVTCDKDKAEYPYWISMLMGNIAWQNIHQSNCKETLLSKIRCCLHPGKPKPEYVISDKEKIAFKVKILKEKINTRRSVYITGREHWKTEKHLQVYRSVITHLMSLQDVTIATYCNSDEMCKVVSQLIQDGEIKPAANFLHIVKDCDKTLQHTCMLSSDRRVKCGETTDERDAIISNVFDVCLLTSGDGHTEQMVQHFLWNDRLVLPVLCDGLQSNLDKIYQVPCGVKNSDWLVLNDIKSSADDIGKTVKKIIEDLLLNITVGTNTHSVAQTTPVRPLKSALKKKHSPSGQRTSLSSQKTVILS